MQCYGVLSPNESVRGTKLETQLNQKNIWRVPNLVRMMLPLDWTSDRSDEVFKKQGSGGS